MTRRSNAEIEWRRSGKRRKSEEEKRRRRGGEKKERAMTTEENSPPRPSVKMNLTGKKALKEQVEEDIRDVSTGGGIKQPTKGRGRK